MKQLESKWLKNSATCAMALLIIFFACQTQESDNHHVNTNIPRRNVVLFVSDDHGKTAGCYGNPVIKTPNMDQLAAEGTLFTNAFATTASCTASRSVILDRLAQSSHRAFWPYAFPFSFQGL